MRQLLRIAASTAVVAFLLYLVAAVGFGTLTAVRSSQAARPKPRPTLISQGRQIFRFDTFGDQAFWGGQLQLHRAIAGAQNGGVGGGVSPKTALAVGLKVDAARIPKKVAAAIKAGKVNLDDPAVTLTLLELNAVVGVRGFFSGGQLSSLGITCAVCHSTVDNSFAPGIGRRRDGWPNRDLNVGAIVGLAPNKKPITDLLGVDEATVDAVLKSWVPASSTPSSSSTARRSGPTGSPPQRSSRPRSACRGSICTRTRAGERSRTGTRSSRTSKCTGSGTSTTSASRIPTSSRSRRGPDSRTCATASTW